MCDFLKKHACILPNCVLSIEELTFATDKCECSPGEARLLPEKHGYKKNANIKCGWRQRFHRCPMWYLCEPEDVDARLPRGQPKAPLDLQVPQSAGQAAKNKLSEFWHNFSRKFEQKDMQNVHSAPSAAVYFALNSPGAAPAAGAGLAACCCWPKLLR